MSSSNVSMSAPDTSPVVDADSYYALLDLLIPPPRSKRFAVVVALSSIAVVVSVVLIAVSGAVVPRLSVTGNAWSATRNGPASFQLLIRNDGLRPATITRLRIDAAGLIGGTLEVRLPVTIRGGESATFAAHFQRIQCPQIRPTQYRDGLQIEANGDVGLTTTITASTSFTLSRPGTRSFEGSDPLRIGWPAGISQEACAA